MGWGTNKNVNIRLTKELNEPVTEKFKRRNVYVRLKDNISAAGLAEMESLSSFNRGAKYL